MITEKEILHTLSRVTDPDIKKDLVTLNMIRNVHINGNTVSFTVMLTTPACPLKEKIKSDCLQALQEDYQDQYRYQITMDAEVTSNRNRENILPHVKNVIAVASGKGGVGKSTVAVNLALGLARKGAKVGLLDADIYGPSIPIMLNIKNEKPLMTVVNGKNYMLPVPQYGIYALSIGFLVDEKQAVVWRGPMVSSALKQFISDCWWGELDYLIIDLPPGTGDVHLTLVQTLPLTGVVVVTTPQEVALADARKALTMFTLDQVKVPVLGVVENMAWFTPEELPENKYFIFGKGGGAKLASEYNCSLLAQIPLVQSIREGGDSGVPAVISKHEITQEAFDQLAEQVAQAIAIRNATFERAETMKA
jgi:ATP-binding protein involved in chromosome partitioning